MSPAELLELLPPFRFNRDIKVKKQSTDNIIIQVLNSHRQHEKDYDAIASYFEGGNIPKKLFDFCKKWLRYSEEKGADQTTRSPAGILTLADHKGVDCKHYSNFIAGVLDALNRKGHDINWCYRFVSYQTKGRYKKKADHVYVVDLDNDVWIDPAPLKDENGNYYDRSFDDRYAIPAFYMDIKMDDMLSHLSGVHYFISEDNVTGNSSGSCVGATLPWEPNVWGETPDTGTTESGGGVLGTVMNTAGSLAELLPDGPLKKFFDELFKNPGTAIINLIKGRKYTKGGYQLGEIFMRNILGMSEVQNNWQVPDAYVPIAEQFFTLALGVEIGSGDHLNQLVKSADAYYAWMPVEVDQVTPRENAERASRILKKMNYGAAIRDRTWPLDWFNAEPYVYPIPDVQAGFLYNGTHPVTGLKLVEGYPKSSVVPKPVENVPEPGSQDPGPGPGPGSPPEPEKAGMNTIGMFLLGGLALGLLMNSKGAKGRKRSRKRKAR